MREKYGMAECPVCGKSFQKKTYNHVVCCNQCLVIFRLAKKTGRDPRKLYLDRQEKKRNEAEEALLCDTDEQQEKSLEFLRKNPRHCHDCGRPTANYRCPDCLAKWRGKNHVVVFNIEEQYA